MITFRHIAFCCRKYFIPLHQTYEKHTISIGSLVVTGIHKSGKFERQTCPIRFPKQILAAGDSSYLSWIKITPFLWQPLLKVL